MEYSIILAHDMSETDSHPVSRHWTLDAKREKDPVSESPHLFRSRPLDNHKLPYNTAVLGLCKCGNN